MVFMKICDVPIKIKNVGEDIVFRWMDGLIVVV